MTISRHYDTVAFDVRENAAMLFFASTRADGDIDSYVLIMRGINDEFEDTVYLEIDEMQISGGTVVREATLDGNLLRLELDPEAARSVGNDTLVLSFDDTERNSAGIRAGSLRVLGDLLVGGHS